MLLAFIPVSRRIIHVEKGHAIKDEIALDNINAPELSQKPRIAYNTCLGIRIMLKHTGMSY